MDTLIERAVALTVARKPIERAVASTVARQQIDDAYKEMQEAFPNVPEPEAEGHSLEDALKKMQEELKYESVEIFGKTVLVMHT